MIPVKGFVCLAKSRESTTFYGPSASSTHEVQTLTTNGLRAFDTIQDARRGQVTLATQAMLNQNLKLDEILIGRINMLITQDKLDLESIKLAESFCVIGTSSGRNAFDFRNVELLGKYTPGAVRMFDSGSRLGDHGINLFTSLKETYSLWREYIRQTTNKATIARISIIAPH